MKSYLILYWVGGAPNWYRASSISNDAASLHASGYMLGVLRERGDKAVGKEFSVFLEPPEPACPSHLRSGRIEGPWGSSNVHWTDGFDEEAAVNNILSAAKSKDEKGGWVSRSDVRREEKSEDDDDPSDEPLEPI